MRFFLIAVVMLAGCSGDHPRVGQPTTLIYASPYSPNHPFSQADQEWIEFVERESNGALHVRPIWSGGLISSDQSMIELRHGVADVGLITPIYAKGGAHLLRTQTGFYSGIRTVEKQVELYRCMASSHAQFSHELRGLKVLAVQGGSLPGIVTRDAPVNTLADLQGLRLRAPTELLPILGELGADPVSMPMGDVYSALAKGIIDGVVAPTDTFRSLHFAEVAGHFAELDVPRGAYPARAMSVDRWNALPRSLQAILERGIPVWERALAEQIRAAVASGAAYAREEGMAFTTISDEDQARFDRIYRAYAERTARSLDRYGIDGLSVLEQAQASITSGGDVDCDKGS